MGILGSGIDGLTRTAYSPSNRIHKRALLAVEDDDTAWMMVLMKLDVMPANGATSRNDNLNDNENETLTL